MEILFDNPFIIIILVAALSSLFKNRKKAAENQRQRSPHTPSRKTAGPSNPFDEMKEIFKEMTSTLSDEEKAPVKKMAEVYEEKKQVVNQFKETGTQHSGKQNIKSGTPQIAVKDTISEEKREPEIKVQEKTLVDAVIWAEILGPPRAKNPYQRRKARS
ncbi:hypothetical protein [Bacillus tuaregi]|uniref:hypothetical protein n=1 Tax=Bacillus tuaregi TaxID=1816695 RepID=UPI0008F7F0DD|nr:hypothetical protein [Bacillus tuaregi]